MKNRTLVVLLLTVGLLLPLSDLLMSQGQENAQQWTLVVERGFKDPSNTAVYSHVIFNDYLYIGTVKGTAGGEIWRTSDGVAWEQVGLDGLGNPKNHGMKVFTYKDKLYVGTLNYDEGMELWVSSNGEKFDKIASHGFGEQSIADTTTPVTFKDQLIIPGYWPGPQPRKGIEIWVSKDGIEFKKVVENGFGYGANNNIGSWMYESKGKLYLVTYDSPYASPKGFQLWSSQDGKNWSQIGKNGFGNPSNYAAGLDIIDDTFYISTLNSANGCEVWKSEDKSNWERIFKENKTRPSLAGGGTIEFKNCLLLTIYDNKNGFDIWRYGPVRFEEKTTTSTITTLSSTTMEISVQRTTTEVEIGPKAADYTSIIIVAIAGAAAVAIILILVLRRPPSVEVKVLRCANCGAQLPSDAEYCIECGAKRKG